MHLGPGWFVERLDVKIVKGNTVEIKGARINFNDKPAIIAAEIKKGEAVENTQGRQLGSGLGRLAAVTR